MKKKSCSVRFALGQLNPTVGDFEANAFKIIDWAKQAERNRADMIIFPEMALCGYPVWDLANKKPFVKECLKRLDQIRRATAGLNITVALGYIDKGAGVSWRSLNRIAFLRNGKLIHRGVKSLLPTYDVFLENIFFEPAKSVEIFSWKGLKIGPTICEDIWDEGYSEKPLEALAKQKAELIVNISSSPYYQGVHERRDELLKKQAVRYRIPMIYVNQVGGQDDLIFDGRSFIVDHKGKVVFRAPAFKEGIYFYDWNNDPLAGNREQAMDSTWGGPREVYEALVLGIRDYCGKNGFKKVLLGLSGGIDSALVCTLAVDALGKDAVLGVAMPGEYSSKGSWEDAKDLAARLGIDFRIYPIRELYKAFLNGQYEGTDMNPLSHGKISLAMENLQARLRGLKLMYLSNDEGRLLLSTGNKSELAMGYCTLYGDMAGGLCVIGDVYKTDVYQLARYRNQINPVIPEATLEKPPSAELRPNQKDQDSLPPYEDLDRILYCYIEKNLGRDEITRKLARFGTPKELIAEIIRKVDHNEYKRRQTPPILRVTEKAWFGRRMPITNRFKG